MKSKDIKALRELSLDKLYKQLNGLKKEYVNLLLQQKIRKVKNLHAANQKRKDIARIKTFIRLQKVGERKD